jgi:hypothetical protein
MEGHVAKIVSVTKLTHNIKSFKIEKPVGFEFEPGQAVDLAINRPRWESEARPFSFTNTPSDHDLEFVIKSYRDHQGVTNLFDSLKRDETIFLGKPFSSYSYKGPGLFLAGGTGITPFLSILRQLNRSGRPLGNRLLWATVTEHDTFYEKELGDLLDSGYSTVVGPIKQSALRKVLKPDTDWVYICGPEKFVAAQVQMVTELGVPSEKILVAEE